MKGKIIISIILCAVLIYIIIISIFVDAEFAELTKGDFIINVESEDDNSFVVEDDIRTLLKTFDKKAQDKFVENLDKDSLESYLLKSQMIKDADVYHDLDGNLYVNVVSRYPMLRVVGDPGFYVDDEGKVMPLSTRATSRVPVATGNITKKFACEELYPFVVKLSSDEFWFAYIEQIEVNSKKEITLIPKMGNFKIELGRLENVDEKMENLFLFLKDGIKLRGWNTYKLINLRFKNQVVCVKK